MKGSRLLVQKFGGTSVGNFERIGLVADKIIQSRLTGDEVVVVVSAMGGETDRLEHMAYQVAEAPNKREMDVLLASGEQITVALLAMALEQRGYRAKSYLGFQVPIRTNGIHRDARITEIDTRKIFEDLKQKTIPIVAGFQGFDVHCNLTTLGRGGSDTTAVALAAVLHANECQIFTDVEGVYTADPRIAVNARKLNKITFEEMLEISSLGAKVLQIRSVEFAGRYKIPLRVLSTFVDGPGTLITFEENVVDNPIISGITYHRDEAKVLLRNLPYAGNTLADIFEIMAKSDICVDVIVQNQPSDGLFDLAFTVHRKDFQETLKLIHQYVQKKHLQNVLVLGDDRVAKLSLIGVGMRSYAGIASKMFQILAQENIAIQLISTSEIKVSVVVDEKYIEQGVNALHRSFVLEEQLKEA
ncbi:MAG: aspartate kinase [Gammaproteobacteria bacterium]